METNLRAFMKEELKDHGTMEFPGIKKFVDEDGKPIPFIIKRLSRKEVSEIRNAYRTTRVYRDKQNGDRPVIGANGQVAVIKDYDADRAGLHLMVAAFQQPRLDDPELMEYYGVLDKLDMPQTIFYDAEDFKYADQCLAEALGLSGKKSETDEVEKLKN